MKGLIIKEFIMFKKQLFTFGIIILVFSVTAIFAENSFSLILPVSLSILPVNFMTLDEHSKWNQYSLALPYGRKNIVSSKYIFSFILTLISMMILTVVYIISHFINSEAGINLTYLLFWSFVMGNIYPAIMIPLAFKFNATNSRTILLVINCIFGGIVGGATTILVSLDNKVTIYKTLFKLFNSPILPVVIIAAIILLYFISWAIAVKIYEKREL